MKGLLTAEEEVILGRIIQQGIASKEILEDESLSQELSELDRRAHERNVRQHYHAIDEFVEKNQGLVYSRARYQAGRFKQAFDFDDLVQDGNMGLLTAIKKFDPERGFKFSTMAVPWIDQAINREMNKTSRMVRLPENRIVEYVNLNKYLLQYSENPSSSPSRKELEDAAQAVGMNLEFLPPVLNAASNHISLNAPVSMSSGSDSGWEVMDLIDSDYTSQSAEEESQKNGVTEEILGFIRDNLHKEPERSVILSALGLSGSMQEVCKQQSITRTAYRKIQKEGMSKLRQGLSHLEAL